MNLYGDSGANSIRGYISAEEEPAGSYKILRKFETPTQKIALVDHEGDLLIYSNGHQMFGTTADEDLFAEAMIHVPMAAARRRKSVLIIGGGGGITTREALRYSDVEKINTLDVDKIMIDFGKKLKPLVQFNKGSLNHPKVETVIEDGRRFVKKNSEKWDVIIVDLPEPNEKNPKLSRLFSREFYSLLKERLNPGGAIGVACSNADSTAEYLWSIHATLTKAGFYVLPYHYFEPVAAENWLFCLATVSTVQPKDLRMSVEAKYLSTKKLRDMFDMPYYFVISKDTGKVQTDDNTVLVEIINNAWYS
ncbi:spermidine synthase [Fictibacillus terranigra]|uniref:Polyamine aminopropyltransferase n=1 Tax=Fictibacillus terranigra TaxID=3058424 RepID=A0ABT8EAR8_9BACL|nr:spermidine synthase [Fictibacillus sp. CENA-BCM004]MDN4074991.1 spermidine synthase [Fictibacillus sp. CENA-BCM004]